MKRSVCFALITLILFNTIGYYVFLLGVQYHHDREFIRALDAEHASLPGIVSFKIPIALPYASDFSEYERINGVIEHEGEFFRLVKHRFFRDTLEIICIKDLQHREIRRALAHHAGSQADETGAVPHAKIIQPLKEFLTYGFSISAAAEGWKMPLCHVPFNAVLPAAYVAAITQPPERG